MKTFAWDIWLYCNYNCKFCNTKTNIFPVKIYSLEEITAAWTNIGNKYGKCKILITGGEPLLYPHIDKIIQKLISIHKIHITTNLSTDIDFLSDISVDKKDIYFNITFHPNYTSADDFIKKLFKLQKYGYDFSICYMSDDLQMTELINYWKLFNKFDFKVAPSVYNGHSRCNEFVKKFVDNNGRILLNERNTKFPSGKFCNAGVSYACIDTSGNVFSCSIKKLNLGNIFDNSFMFLEKKVECNERCKLSENKY